MGSTKFGDATSNKVKVFSGVSAVGICTGVSSAKTMIDYLKKEEIDHSNEFVLDQLKPDAVTGNKKNGSRSKLEMETFLKNLNLFSHSLLDVFNS